MRAWRAAGVTGLGVTVAAAGPARAEPSSADRALAAASASPSRCEVARDGVEGGFCAGNDPVVRVNCQERDGLRCDTFGSGRCVPLGTEGAPCFSFFDCAGGFYCRGRACTAKAGVGAPCTPDDDLGCGGAGSECLIRACDRGLRCDAASRTCVEGLPLGAPCVDSRECASDFCGEGAICHELGLIATPGLCGGVAPEGALDPAGPRPSGRARPASPPSRRAGAGGPRAFRRAPAGGPRRGSRRGRCPAKKTRTWVTDAPSISWSALPRASCTFAGRRSIRSKTSGLTTI